jgi:hypothetical protein
LCSRPSVKTLGYFQEESDAEVGKENPKSEYRRKAGEGAAGLSNPKQAPMME